MPAIHDIIGHQKQYFHTGKTLDYEFRLRRLCQLEHVIHKYKEAIAQALKKDLNKSYMESYVTEIGIVLSEISYVKKRLKLWMRTRVVPSSVLQFPGISKIYISVELSVSADDDAPCGRHCRRKLCGCQTVGTVAGIGRYHQPYAGRDFSEILCGRSVR